MTLSTNTVWLLSNKFMCALVWVRVWAWACVCVCQLASIRIVQCLSIKTLSDFEQSVITTTATSTDEQKKNQNKIDWPADRNFSRIYVHFLRLSFENAMHCFSVYVFLMCCITYRVLFRFINGLFHMYSFDQNLNKCLFKKKIASRPCILFFLSKTLSIFHIR